MDILKIKSQIKSPYFNIILKISKSSQNDLKSDFVKSSIKSLNTLVGRHKEGRSREEATKTSRTSRKRPSRPCTHARTIRKTRTE
jgi:hypothetical protein